MPGKKLHSPTAVSASHSPLTRGTGFDATAKAAQLVAGCQHELDIARTDLSAAIHDLEMSGEAHCAVNEEALWVNEALLTSKEELQALNEELTTRNGQLQESLEHQRATANDLKHVLYSTKVATLFLDRELRIRFFTPATKKLFHLIPGDIGRPLADLQALAIDPTLAQDAQAVLIDGLAHDCDVAAPDDSWFSRLILPYRADADGIEGVVISFTDITEKKRARAALEAAKHVAETANLAKSRFLAAASHDLRQPLQSLALLQRLLEAKVKDPAAESLLLRFAQTLTAMSATLNTVLDMNQIDAGFVQAQPVDFIIGDLIGRVCAEFAEQARIQRLRLSSVHCSRMIHSDPVMVEQMLRNLVSNALTYTKHGGILLGCRQRGNRLRIEVWDTGVGIAAAQLDEIFEEYHQIDNATREASLGLGLGLSVVQRLGTLLGHKVGVRSLPGCGSVFSIDVNLAISRAIPVVPKLAAEIAALPRVRSAGNGPTIYIVDDDSDVRRSLRELLETDGRNVEDFGDCEAFLAAYHPGGEACLLIDAYLPGIDGIELLRRLKAAGSHLPAIMITGSSAVPMAVEAMKVGAIDFIEKPVSVTDLLASVNRALLLSRDEAKLLDWQADAILHLNGLTPRQLQVMEMVLAGHPSKNIAADLGISQRTVENHRASIMKKTGSKSLPALARLALAATGSVAVA